MPEQTMVDRFWKILEQDGYCILNHREGGPLTTEDLEKHLLFLGNNFGFRLPPIPAHSQNVRIAGKGRSWFFVYAKESSSEHGIFWGIARSVLDHFRNESHFKWVIVLLHESESSGWWTEPTNVERLIQGSEWSLKSDGDYICNFGRGLKGCVPFHNVPSLQQILDGFAEISVPE
jgi:hypothetical protein